MERVKFLITKLERYKVILGKPWMNKYNPNINWPIDKISFTLSFCKKYCLYKLCSTKGCNNASCINLLNSITLNFTKARELRRQ